MRFQIASISLLFFIALAITGLATPLTIDTFGTPEGTKSSIYGYQGSGASYTGDTQADAVGGFRDVFVILSNPSSGAFEYVKQELISGVLQYSSSAKAYGSVGIIYGSSQALNLNLADSFLKNESFLFEFANPIDASISMLLQLVSTNSSKAMASVTIPAGTKTYLIPFSLFSFFGPGDGTGSQFDPAHVSMIYPSLNIGAPGSTYKLDTIAIVPEPATILFCIAGAALFVSSFLVRSSAHRRTA